MKVLHSWLREYIGEAIPEPAALETLLTFHAFEVEECVAVGDTTRMDIKVLPDRASDCLSHRGIAFEIATCLGVPLQHDPLLVPCTEWKETTRARVRVHQAEDCSRFMCAVIEGVTVTESPAWLRDRLEALGQRSINNIVDATNYVMLALGQPLHAYDADFLGADHGVHHLGVRRARDGESVVTLSDQTLALNPTVLVITDETTDTPLGVAGIKGGKSSEIRPTTKTIILEAAHFNPVTIRKASQALRLTTDASKRFENTLSPTLAPYGLDACIALITEIAGGACAGVVDVYPTPLYSREPVTITATQCTGLLGIEIPHETITGILNRLGGSVVTEPDRWVVTPPILRTDIVIAEDLIAEVGRLHGYDAIKSVLPTPVPLPEINASFYYAEKIRSFLVARGFTEVITSSFREQDMICLQNALASDKGCLRSSLAPSLAMTLHKNMAYLDLLETSSLALFEIGTVFFRTEDGSDVTEACHLSFGVRTKTQGYVPADDRLLKEHTDAITELLGVTLPIVRSDEGVVELSLTELVGKLPKPTAYETYEPQGEITYVPYSVYPHSSRDVAVWVGEHVTSESIASTIRSVAGDLLVRCTLFDTFARDGRVSYAFRLVFQSSTRTLTEDDVMAPYTRVTEALTAQGFEIR